MIGSHGIDRYYPKSNNPLRPALEGLLSSPLDGEQVSRTREQTTVVWVVQDSYVICVPVGAVRIMLNPSDARVGLLVFAARTPERNNVRQDTKKSYE